MPIREYSCQNETCRLHGYRRERFEQSTPPPAPVCECGEMLSQLVSNFAVTFSGAITARYNDKDKEGAHLEGHWIQEKRAPGGPKWTYVEDWQTRKRIMKQEGLEEGGPAEAGADGKSISSAGLPGSWI